MVDGYRLPYLSRTPVTPKAVIVALHGFNDYSNAFTAFCDAMSRADIACFAYDQRGFGATQQAGYWPQPRQHQHDVRAVVALLRARYPGLPVYVAGESMGGAVILDAWRSSAAIVQRPPNAAVLFAPAVWARATQPWYQRLALWIAVHTTPGWQPTGEGLGVQASDNIEALRALGRDPLVIKASRIDTLYGLTNLMDQALEASAEFTLPTAVFYGANDEVIPKAPTCAMLKQLEAGENALRFRLYEDGWHLLTRDLQAARLHDHVIAFLDQVAPGQALPSQAVDTVMWSEVAAYCQ